MPEKIHRRMPQRSPLLFASATTNPEEPLFDLLHLVFREGAQALRNSGVDVHNRTAAEIESDVAIHVQKLAHIHQHIVRRGMDAPDEKPQ